MSAGSVSMEGPTSSVCRTASSVIPLLTWTTILLLSILLLIALFLLHRARAHLKSHARVTDMFIYPIKGCAGIRVSAAAVTPRGLAGDRLLMVVRGSDGAFQTQRQLPAMATVRPTWGEAGDLVLSAPGSPDFVLLSAGASLAAAPAEAERRAARVWRHTVPDAIDCGDAAAAWLSAALGEPDLRLVRMPDEHRRPVSGADKGHRGVVSFADGYPLLLASEASRAAVQAHAALPHLSMQRFRPNVVVEGENLAPFEELRWREVAVGDVAFDAPVECRRCQVPRIDPASGTPDSLPEMQPTAALNKLTKNHFGVNLTPILSRTSEATHVVRVGDRVRVVRKEDNKAT